MTGRQLFFGVALLLWGGANLLCNRMLAEEAESWHDRLPAEWPTLRPHIPLLLGRIIIIVGGLVSICFGVLLLTRMID